MNSYINITYKLQINIIFGITHKGQCPHQYSAKTMLFIFLKKYSVKTNINVRIGEVTGGVVILILIPGK